MILAIFAIVIVSSGERAPDDRVRIGKNKPGHPGPAAPAAEQRCIDVWNDPSNLYHGQVESVGRDVTAYVSVGFADDFPDKCLITIAWPEIADSRQYLEGGAHGGTFVSRGEGSIPPAALPESVKQWNAEAQSDGTLMLLR